jgi:hypothetical protein
LQADIESLKRQVVETDKKREEMKKRVVAGPRVEEHYKVLMTERTNTQAKYDDLMKKAMEAKMASGLEKGQMGERFTLIDAARLPEKPVRPNIPAILVIGFILGIGGGVGMASLKEYSDQSARTVEALAAATSVTVLGGVPEIVIAEDIDREKKKSKGWLIALIVCFLVGLVLVHFLYMDLDVLWARIIRRLAL